MITSFNALNPTVPPINQLMELTALRIASTIGVLTERGFVVIGIEFSNGSKPTIQIQLCAECAELIAKGEATYYRTGGSGSGRYRVGQFKVGEIRVLWNERGTEMHLTVYASYGTPTDSLNQPL